MKNNFVYLPQRVEELISQLDYKRKDDLRIICDMIYRRQIYFRSKLQEYYGYLEIPRASFVEFIGNPNITKQGLDILIEEGIIFRNDFYVRGAKSKGYKIANELLGTKLPVTIIDKGINKRLDKKRADIRKNKVKNLEFVKTKYYKTFNIDVEGALLCAKNKAMYEIYDLCEALRFPISYKEIDDIIECENDYGKTRALILLRDGGYELHHILHRLMTHQMKIYAIKDGWLYFKRNDTNGRLDTNLTSLPTYLRKFIICDEELYHLDIANSQPFFLATLLQNDPNIDQEELVKYKELVTNGGFYEYLMDEYNKTFGTSKTRAQMKNMTFRIYYSKVTSYQKDKEFFRGLFPTIMDFIDRTNEENNSKLSNALSTIESFTILDKVMVELQTLAIKPFTIHDSFIVTEKELQIVEETFKRIVMDLHGFLPNLHNDKLIDIKEDFEEEIDEWDFDDNDLDIFLNNE